MSPPFSVTSPAKVNLFLHVLGKREDGYHNLETWMQKIDLFDFLSFQLTDTGKIEFFCTDETLPGNSNNLAVRAALLFLKESKVLAGAGLQLVLEKHIPVAAGLGGGSSNAGTVLRTLNQLAGDEFTETKLIEMARKLGADVPFFVISSSAALAEGIGELLQPIDSLRNYQFILVNPGFAVSTADIFQKLVLTSKEKKSKIARLQRRKYLLEDIENDLEKITCSLYPQIATIKQSLLDVGAAKVLMSGSGPTVYGLFDSRSVIKSETDRALKLLKQEYGNKVFLSSVFTGA